MVTPVTTQVAHIFIDNAHNRKQRDVVDEVVRVAREVPVGEPFVLEFAVDLHRQLTFFHLVINRCAFSVERVDSPRLFLCVRRE